MHSRRGLAGMLAGGLIAPTLARAAPREVHMADDPGRSIVAAVKPRALTPGETIETAHDPYRRMTAPLEINGQPPVYFVVDTGANQSVISTELAAALKLPAGPMVTVHGVADAEQTQSVIAARVKVGSRIEKDVLMPVLPEAAIGAPGLLGIDRLRNQRLILDFRAKQMIVEQSTFQDLPPFTSRVHARQRSGQLMIVDADLAGIPVWAFLDSGAERTIGNPALLQLAVLRNPQGGFYDVPVISVTGKIIPGQIALLPILRLGHVRMVDIAVTFADLHVFQIWGLTKPSILIGMDALSTFDAVTLDFARAEVLFQLYPK